MARTVVQATKALARVTRKARDTFAGPRRFITSALARALRRGMGRLRIRRHVGPGRPGRARPPAAVAVFPETHFSKICIFQMLRSTKSEKKLRYGPRDPSRKIRTEILVKIRVRNVQNGWMATHLVTKKCDLGPLGFRAQLAHPGTRPGRGRGFAESLGLLVLHQPLIIHTPKIASPPLRGD